MPKMRQVIKTNHNFFTGEHYEQRVLKPVQAAQNRVTVQLCDPDTGQVVEEATTENYITPTLESLAYNSIAHILDYPCKASNGGPFDTMPSYLGANSGYTRSYSNDLNNQIILSDSEIDEGVDNYIIDGKYIGYSDVRGSGITSDTFAGSFNAAESFSEMTDDNYRHIHLVYDWPTSAGNGNIRSIYWSSRCTDVVQPNLFKIVKQSTARNIGSAENIVFDKRGNTYFYNSSDKKYYKILNQIEYLFGIKNMQVSDVPEAIYSKTEVNGHYYTASTVSEGSGSSYNFKLRIRKYDTSGNLLDTWDEDLITGCPKLVEARQAGKMGKLVISGTDAYVSFSNYCDNDGWVGVTIAYGAPSYSSSYRYLPSYDYATHAISDNNSTYAYVHTMYNVLTKRWRLVPDPWNVETRCIYFNSCHVVSNYGDYKTLYGDTYIPGTPYYNGYRTSSIKINSDGSISWQSTKKGIYRDYSTLVPVLHGIHATLPFCTCRINSADLVCIIEPYLAHTKLAAPIRKTSLNTMKIQYDFFFKVPIPYFMPDHVWDLYK